MAFVSSLVGDDWHRLTTESQINLIELLKNEINVQIKTIKVL